MPTSDYHQISDVLHVVEQANPTSLLDVGVGFGKWGILCREILEIYKSRVQPETWEIQIDGVEIHEAYRNPLWTLAYNQIHIGDALDVLDSLGHYDLILCCDVIEHFEKERGRLLLKKLCRHSKLTVITSPRGFAPQQAIYGNEYERHKSGWSAQDFADIPHSYKDVGFTFLAVLSSDAARVKTITLRDPLQVLGAKRAAINTLKLMSRNAGKRFQSFLKPREYHEAG